MTPKTLVWHKGTHRSEFGDFIAKSALGEYSCRPWRGEWTPWFRERCISDKPGGVREAFTLAEAKRQAQMHFDQRARSMVRDLMAEV